MQVHLSFLCFLYPYLLQHTTTYYCQSLSGYGHSPSRSEGGVVQSSIWAHPKMHLGLWTSVPTPIASFLSEDQCTTGVTTVQIWFGFDLIFITVYRSTFLFIYFFNSSYPLILHWYLPHWKKRKKNVFQKNKQLKESVNWHKPEAACAIYMMFFVCLFVCYFPLGEAEGSDWSLMQLCWPSNCYFVCWQNSKPYWKRGSLLLELQWRDGSKFVATFPAHLGGGKPAVLQCKFITVKNKWEKRMLTVLWGFHLKKLSVTQQILCFLWTVIRYDRYMYTHYMYELQHNYKPAFKIILLLLWASLGNGQACLRKSYISRFVTGCSHSPKLLLLLNNGISSWGMN